MPKTAMKIGLVLTMSSLATASSALAAETVTYSYDAKGRLTKVVHSGSVNSGVTTDYSHDNADNRANVKTTGAPS
jgi:YD repeat-containing protein